MEIVHVRHDANHMATTFELTVSCEERAAPAARGALDECHRTFSQLEQELSEFIPSSPVFQLNRASVSTRVALTPSLRHLLEESKKVRLLTAGSFDCEAKSARPADGRGRMEWDDTFVWRSDDAAHLGFGAIGKGYALDRARTLLEQSGFTNYRLVAGGSSVLLSGLEGPGSPWIWGWRLNAGSEVEARGFGFHHPSAAPIAIGVSGMQEKAGHLLDPRQNERSGSSVLSALVVHSSAALADAFSTGLFISGWSGAASWPVTAPIAMAVVEADGTRKWNRPFQRLFGALALFIACAGLLIVEGRAALAEVSATPASEAISEEAVDLGSLGLDSFAPYLVERHPAWVLAPLLSLGLLALHLKKSPRKPARNRRQNATS